VAHLLVVDDNPANREVLTRLLEFEGHEVDQAFDGRDALAKVWSLEPDLILMDLAMPDLDGWDATAALKADPMLRDIPVIVVTGHVTRDEIERALVAGCQDVISKPIDFYVLKEKVARHVAASRAGGRSADLLVPCGQ
jgi:two-component system, cell cycle response regulator DivK